jgi:stage II sporulation protein AA (anti-sigma F factor antagonist)
MSDSRYFQVSSRGDVLVLRMRAVHLDRNAANELWADLSSLLKQRRVGHMLINLADVTQISSPVLAKLIAFDRQVSAGGGKMLICEAAPAVHQIISLAWPGRWTEEPTTEDAAVAELDS